MTIGTLYIIAAPSGAGKTSLVNALVKSMTNIEVSISYTTRAPRPGEANGIHYWFVSQAKFTEMIAQNRFLEYAHVFGHSYYYGTTHDWVEQRLNAGVDVILEIDWQGAQQVRQKYSEVVSIFILPPSKALLKERLLARQQDKLEVIQQRIVAAKNEVKHFREFDYLVINDIFDLALADLQTIVRANRLLQYKQALKYAALLHELL